MSERMQVIHLEFFLFIFCRGEQFRKEYSRLSEVRSILPRNVNVMALTATATKSLRNEVSALLSMENPVVVSDSVCPDKKNIKYLVARHVTMEKTLILDPLLISCMSFKQT